MGLNPSEEFRISVTSGVHSQNTPGWDCPPGAVRIPTFPLQEHVQPEAADRWAWQRSPARNTRTDVTVHLQTRVFHRTFPGVLNVTENKKCSTEGRRDEEDEVGVKLSPYRPLKVYLSEPR